jgi:filamentous hemagglutinin family protein
MAGLRKSDLILTPVKMLKVRIKPLVLVIAAVLPAPTFALPTAPTVVAGSAAFATSGNTLTVTNSNGAIINWNSFSIGQGELTKFIQPSAASQVLNRVTGGDPSQILGSLRSEIGTTGIVGGKVFLINPNGIAFGPGAQVNVGGLVASTLALSDADFLANKLNFTATPGAGAISNAGSIETTAGGQILLIAPSIENSGILKASNGDVVLAAGKRVSIVDINQPEIEFELTPTDNQLINSGKLEASAGRIGILGGMVIHTGEADASSVVAEGGRILLKAGNALQSGSLSANGTTGGDIAVEVDHRIIQTASAKLEAKGSSGSGGSIRVQAGSDASNNDGIFSSATFDATGTSGGKISVTGADVTLLAATLDASGTQGGGTVHVGGEWQGSGSLPHAQKVLINSTTQIKADAIQSGNGGEVVVWSDIETNFQGKLSARGGASSGNGGRMEVSSKDTVHFAGLADAGAPKGSAGKLLLDPKNIVIEVTGSTPAYQLLDPHPVSGNRFGQNTTVLANENVIVAVPTDGLVASNAGAVYLFNGQTGALISTLTGSYANDKIGSNGVTLLSNGNYVINSSSWNSNRGSVTWASASSGVSGIVSSTNSLVGTSNPDRVGSDGITALPNGNYLVNSASWNQNRGAVTWADGTQGIAGVVSSSNSLIGSWANTFNGQGDYVGSGGIVVLSNGNYVVSSPLWRSAGSVAGAVTWANSATGISGAVSSGNSFVGTGADQVGSNGITVLTNGNYVISSPYWSSNRGAVTWADGSTGLIGTPSSSNSLIGSSMGDYVGGWGVVALTNGNYVVASADWNGGRGAATLASGATGLVGTISSSNSLVGLNASDAVGGYITALTNGNYVVVSRMGTLGAATWGSGTSGVTGFVTTSNSLKGALGGDQVGCCWSGNNGVKALANGNYIVLSPGWSSNKGAVTWGNGVAGVVGTVSSINSLVGANPDASPLGSFAPTVLANGNLVFKSRVNNSLFAFMNAATGATGVISDSSNSWQSTSGYIVALPNGNYLIVDKPWSSYRGAVTWANGTTGIIGFASSANSLVGSTANDANSILSYGVTVLNNGNYVVRTPGWDNGGVVDAGAVTWANGSTGIVGTISSANSLVGTSANDRVGYGVYALTNGHYVVTTPDWNNAGVADVGAVTWGNGTSGRTGAVSTANSLIGASASDFVGIGGVLALSNGNYLVLSSAWNGSRGAVTLGNGSAGTVGTVTYSGSFTGINPGDYIGGNDMWREMTNGNVLIANHWANNDTGRVDVLAFSPSLSFGATPGAGATVPVSWITSVTDTGTAVTLQANNDITINSAITTSAGGNGGSLTMQAGRSILINADITTDNGGLTLSANDPGAISAYRDAGVGNITMAAGTTINSGTGAFNANLNSGGGTITLRDITAGAVDARGAVQNLGTTTLTTLAMSGGDLTLGAGGSMVVSGLANIVAGNTLNLSGGSFSSGSLGISGILNLSSGTFSTGATTIANGGTFTLSGGSATFSGPMTVQSGGTLNYGLAGTTTIPGASSNAGTMNFTAGTASFGGGLTQTAGTMTLNGGNVTGNVAINGGTLGGSGTLTGNLDIGPSGILAVGFSPGTLNVTGNLTLASTATTNIEIGGLTAGTQFDLINVTGLATLDGTLNVTSWGGYTPAAGNSFNFLTFGSSSGAFAMTNLPAGWNSALSPFATYMQLAIPSAVLPPAIGGGSLITIAPDALPGNDTQLAFDQLMMLADASAVGMLTMPGNPEEELRQCR